MRPIDADALKKAITDATYNFEQIPIRVDKVQEIIDNSPTVEAVEFEYHSKLIKQAYQKGKDIRPHGEWIFKETTDDYKVYGQCSICKQRKRIDNYCPNCGADMRGDT